MQVYERCCEFLNKYNGTVAWRIKKHAKVIEKHLNPGEEIIYVFTGQKNDKFYDLFNTYIFVLTNKRLLMGRKRVIWGYFLKSITPDLYNDMEVYNGLLWGKVTIDTIKEIVIITNLSKKSLPEIETNISEYMIKAKRKYKTKEELKKEYE